MMSRTKYGGQSKAKGHNEWKFKANGSSVIVIYYIYIPIIQGLDVIISDIINRAKNEVDSQKNKSINIIVDHVLQVDAFVLTNIIVKAGSAMTTGGARLITKVSKNIAMQQTQIEINIDIIKLLKENIYQYIYR